LSPVCPRNYKSCFSGQFYLYIPGRRLLFSSIISSSCSGVG
jgi:hypothetical protein